MDLLFLMVGVLDQTAVALLGISITIFRWVVFFHLGDAAASGWLPACDAGEG